MYIHTVNVSHSTILEMIFVDMHFRNTEGLPIPLDITIQTFVGLILAMIAVLNIAGDFKEIRASVEMSAKSWETVSNRPSFYVYNHRVGCFVITFREMLIENMFDMNNNINC